MYMELIETICLHDFITSGKHLQHALLCLTFEPNHVAHSFATVVIVIVVAAAALKPAFYNSNLKLMQPECLLFEMIFLLDLRLVAANSEQGKRMECRQSGINC